MPFSHPARLSCFPGRRFPCSCRPLCGRHLSAGQAGPPEKQKYQQGLKALENRLPLEASKHFQECLSSQNLAESQKAIIRPFLAEALIRAKKRKKD